MANIELLSVAELESPEVQIAAQKRAERRFIEAAYVFQKVPLPKMHDDGLGPEPREVAVTPYEGHYGTAGVVVTINGSPTRGTAIMTRQGHGRPLVHFMGMLGDMHRLNPDVRRHQELWLAVKDLAQDLLFA